MSNFPDQKETDELYQLDVSKYIGKDYIPYLDDVARMVTIQLIIQFMLFLQAPSTNPFFDGRFFGLLFYIVLGVSMYWLVLKKLVKLT